MLSVHPQTYFGYWLDHYYKQAVTRKTRVRVATPEIGFNIPAYCKA
jgi:hypothetical protein